MLENTLNKIRPLIPRQIFGYFQPAYHFLLSLTGAIIYRFPSRKIKVIGVTGTKGKSTTTEIINAILEEAGYKTTVSNTIRYKIGNVSIPNKFKMSMPGRFFVQKLIRQAVDMDCDYVVLEMTSQGTLQYRHKFIELDGFVFTNISPEHIESHGSFENYVNAKVEIGKQLSKSSKRPRVLVVNGDDKEANRFLDLSADVKISYKINNDIETPLLGEFNRYNVTAAFEYAKAIGIDEKIIRKAIAKFKDVPGRVQFVEAGQDFNVVVDYAHTPDSLEKFYTIFKDQKNICILGGTGGGRDNWKRKEMGRIADKFCSHIILSDEDPYDENPDQIVNDVASGITNKKPEIIMDRRQAIAKAISLAKSGDNILITGKGTDPFIMGPNGTKTVWSDAEVAKEEIKKSQSI
jgi:UDP-N-acetylmuramoyl-L-alanyl-D-glutamate--2,6-diaminopimelate ligase